MWLEDVTLQAAPGKPEGPEIWYNIPASLSLCARLCVCVCVCVCVRVHVCALRLTAGLPLHHSRPLGGRGEADPHRVRDYDWAPVGRTGPQRPPP